MGAIGLFLNAKCKILSQSQTDAHAANVKLIREAISEANGGTNRLGSDLMLAMGLPSRPPYASCGEDAAKLVTLSYHDTSKYAAELESKLRENREDTLRSLRIPDERSSLTNAPRQ
jgi:hypothetical protein